MSAHDYQIAAEPDVSGKINRHIWLYFILLSSLLGLTVVGLTIMYRFSVDYEKTEKIGRVHTEEFITSQNVAQSILTGKRALFEGKKHVPIDVAMDRFVREARRLD